MLGPPPDDDSDGYSASDMSEMERQARERRHMASEGGGDSVSEADHHHSSPTRARHDPTAFRPYTLPHIDRRGITSANSRPTETLSSSRPISAPSHGHGSREVMVHQAPRVPIDEDPIEVWRVRPRANSGRYALGRRRRYDSYIDTLEDDRLQRLDEDLLRTAAAVGCEEGVDDPRDLVRHDARYETREPHELSPRRERLCEEEGGGYVGRGHEDDEGYGHADRECKSAQRRRRGYDPENAYDEDEVSQRGSRFFPPAPSRVQFRHSHGGGNSAPPDVPANASYHDNPHVSAGHVPPAADGVDNDAWPEGRGKMVCVSNGQSDHRKQQPSVADWLYGVENVGRSPTLLEWVNRKLPTMIEAERLARAAAYLGDAIECRPVRLVGGGLANVRAYTFQKHHIWARFIQALAIIHTLLALWEPPRPMSDAASFHDSMARHAFTGAAHRSIRLLSCEMVLVLLFIFDVGLEVCALGASKFFGLNRPHAVMQEKARDVAFEAKVWGQARFALVVLFIADVSNGIHSHGHCTRFSRALRPIYIVCLFETLRRWSKLVGLLIWQLKEFLAASAIVLGLFSLLGLVLLSETGCYGPSSPLAAIPYQNFNNFLNSFIAMYVLATTQNYGELMIPAYTSDISRGTSLYFFFFAAFVVAVVLFLAHLSLPRVYFTFTDFQRQQAFQSRLLERLALVMTFRCLDSDRRGYVVQSLTCSLNDDPILRVPYTWLRRSANIHVNVTAEYLHFMVADGPPMVIRALSMALCVDRYVDINHFRAMLRHVRPDFFDPTSGYELDTFAGATEHLFSHLARIHPARIYPHEFLSICEIVLTDFHPISPTLPQGVPAPEWHQRERARFRAYLSSRWCELVSMTLLLLALFFLSFYGSPSVSKHHLRAFSYFVIVIFWVELTLKFWALGPRTFIHSASNIVDALTVGPAFIAILVYACAPKDSAIGMSPQAADIGVLFLVMRAVRLFPKCELFSRFASAYKVLPFFFASFWLCVLLVYFWAIVGMAAFTTSPIAPNLLNPELAPWAAVNNFDSLWSTSITLFQVATTYDWHRIMYAWMALENTAWAGLYFIAFHLLARLIVTQLTTALFIDAFIVFEGSSLAAKARGDVEPEGDEPVAPAHTHTQSDAHTPGLRDAGSGVWSPTSGEDVEGAAGERSAVRSPVGGERRGTGGVEARVVV